MLTRSFEDAHHSDKTEKCVSHISHAVSSWTTGEKKAKKPFKGAIAVNSNTGGKSWQDLRCDCVFNM